MWGNAVGALTGQPAVVLSRHYDTNLGQFTTNTFQAFDLDLTVGANQITLHASDMAGNVSTSNYTYTLDYSSKTNPPVVQLYWPTNGAVISGTNFTWRGSVDDPTVTLWAQIVDSSGNTNVAPGIVERNGNFWVENLPLAAGTSSLTLTATDATGTNASTTNITVVQSSVGLSITSIPDITCQKTITVSGTIGTSGYSVWVNGVLSSQSGTSWTANNVPVNGTGTAVIQALAISTSDNNGNGATGTGGGGTNSSLTNPGNPTPSAAWAAPCCEAAPDKLPVIVYTQYHRNTSITNDAHVLAWNGLASRQTHSEDWSLGVGGQTLGTGCSCENDGVVGGTDLTGLGFGWESTAWDAATGIGTITQGTSSTDWDYSQTDSWVTGSDWYSSAFTGSASSGSAADYDGTGTESDLDWWDSMPDYESGGISDHYMTGMAYVPNGKAVPVPYLVAFTATATGASGTGWTPSTYGILGDLSWSSIPPTQITVAGSPLDSDGIINKRVPSGSPPIDITPRFDAGPTPSALAAFWGLRLRRNKHSANKPESLLPVDGKRHSDLASLRFHISKGNPWTPAAIAGGIGRWGQPWWCASGLSLVLGNTASSSVTVTSRTSGNACNTILAPDPAGTISLYLRSPYATDFHFMIYATVQLTATGPLGSALAKLQDANNNYLINGAVSTFKTNTGPSFSVSDLFEYDAQIGTDWTLAARYTPTIGLVPSQAESTAKAYGQIQFVGAIPK